MIADGVPGRHRIKRKLQLPFILIGLSHAHKPRLLSIDLSQTMGLQIRRLYVDLTRQKSCTKIPIYGTYVSIIYNPTE